MNWKATPLKSKRRGIPAFLLIGVVIVSGCRTLGYYGQAIEGQYQIVAREQPIAGVLADTNTPAKLKQRLELVEQLCAFAQTNLHLPADGHYRNYADLHRPYVVWNVQAAGPFSLQPKTWWYPFVGSLEYHGYFSEQGARDCGKHLESQGYEVYVDGIEAYSTLGWFKDPVLNTFVFNSAPELAETLFHELGHQRLFVSGDTDFNEAYATTVGQEGARRWLVAKGDTNLCARYAVALQRNQQFVHLILNTRTRLMDIYGDTMDKDGKVKAAPQPPQTMGRLRKEKQQVFDELRDDYAQLKSEWGGFAGYDAWFGHELNNAQLNTVANYYDYLPGFKRLLELNGGDLEKFYPAVERLGKLSKEDRHQRLRELAEESSRE